MAMANIKIHSTLLFVCLQHNVMSSMNGTEFYVCLLCCTKHLIRRYSKCNSTSTSGVAK